MYFWYNIKYPNSQTPYHFTQILRLHEVTSHSNSETWSHVPTSLRFSFLPPDSNFWTVDTLCILYLSFNPFTRKFLSPPPPRVLCPKWHVSNTKPAVQRHWYSPIGQVVSRLFFFQYNARLDLQLRLQWSWNVHTGTFYSFSLWPWPVQHGTGGKHAALKEWGFANRDKLLQHLSFALSLLKVINLVIFSFKSIIT